MSVVPCETMSVQPAPPFTLQLMDPSVVCTSPTDSPVNDTVTG